MARRELSFHELYSWWALSALIVVPLLLVMLLFAPPPNQAEFRDAITKCEAAVSHSLPQSNQAPKFDSNASRTGGEVSVAGSYAVQDGSGAHGKYTCVIRGQQAEVRSIQPG